MATLITVDVPVECLAEKLYTARLDPDDPFGKLHLPDAGLVVALPLGANSFTLKVPSIGWPDTPERTIKLVAEISYDGGQSWEFFCSGSANGAGINRLTGLRYTERWTERNVPQPENPNRQIRTSIIALQDINTGLTALCSARAERAAPAHQSVAIDVSSSNTVSGLTSISLSHAAGTPTGVGFALGFFSENETISAITYGGTTMGAAVVTARTAAFENRASIYGLANPAAGTQTATITFGGTVDAALDVITVTGGVTSAPVFSNSNSATGTSTAPSVAVTSAADEFVMDCVTNVGGSALTVDGSQAQRQNATIGGGNYGCSTEAGAASVPMDWTAASSTNWAIAAMSFDAAPAGPGVNAPTKRSRGFNLQQMADDGGGKFDDLDVRNWFRSMVPA